MIQPELSTVPRIKNNSVCPPLLPPFLLALTPLILHPSLSIPSSFFTPHSSHPISVPFSLIITSNRARATKSGNVARKEGMYGEKVSSNAWEMWFPIRLSKVMLHTLDKLAVPVEAEEYSLTRINWFLTMCCGICYERKTKYLISKSFFSWGGKSRPR